MLVWFLYLKIAFKTGCQTLSVRVSATWYSGIFKFLTALEKNLFKTVAFLPSLLMILSPSTKIIFSTDITLSEKKWFDSSPKLLITCNIFFHLDWRSSFSLSFVKEKHSDSAAYYKQCFSLHFSFLDRNFSNEFFSFSSLFQSFIHKRGIASSWILFLP